MTSRVPGSEHWSQTRPYRMLTRVPVSVMSEGVVWSVLRCQDDVFGVTAPPRASCSQSTPASTSLACVNTGQTCLGSRETCQRRVVRVLVTSRVTIVTRSRAVAGAMESALHKTRVMMTRGNTSRVQMLTNVTWTCTTVIPMPSASTLPSRTRVNVSRDIRGMGDSPAVRRVTQAVVNMASVPGTQTTRVSVTWAGLGTRVTRGVSVMATARVIVVWVSVTTVTTTLQVNSVRYVLRDSLRAAMTVFPAKITVMVTQTRVFWRRTTGHTCVSTVRMEHVDPDVTRVWQEHSERPGHCVSRVRSATVTDTATRVIR